MLDFPEILQDLELKRAAALPRDERPAVDVSAALAVEMPDVQLVDTVPPGPLTAAHVADVVAGALSALALAHGEAEANTAAARGTVGATTAAVARRLHDARRITVHDLSSIVEAVLIEAGQYDIARALVLDRAPAPAAPGPGAPRLIRRNGDVAAWDPRKIEVAIRTAFLSLQDDPAPAAGLAARVDERARGLGLLYVPIETVQDIVQEELVLGGHMRVAERYIVYRAERALLRAREERPAAPAAEADDLRRRIAFASIGLDLEMDADELAQELRRSTHAGMHDADLRRLVVLNAKALVERDSELSRFAGRILLTYLYEETLGWDVRREDVAGLRGAHARGSATDSGARRRDRSDRCAAAGLRPRPPRRGARSVRGSRLRLPGPADALRPLPHLRQDGRCAAAHRGAAGLLDARRDGGVPGRAAGRAHRARHRPLRHVQAAALLLVDAHALQRGDEPLPAELLLPLLHLRHPRLDRRKGHRGERHVLEVGRRPGRLVDGGARHRIAHRVHERREPGRRAVPEDAQRPARRGQPGRQARGLGLRVPRGLAQRHPRVPRAAPQHRRRAPAHARHEHRVLGSRPVHAARGGPRAVDALPFQRRTGPARPLRPRVRGALRGLRGARGRRRDARRGHPGPRAVEGDAADALRDRAPLDHLQGPVQRAQSRRTTRASCTRRTSARRSR